MRAIALCALAVFFPVVTYAADAPTLTTYTISHGTIYPTATAASGLATTTSIDTAFSEPVKASIKIISAGAVLIKSLYSSQSVTNPTPKIWDGTNSAGARVADGTYTVLISATSTATGLSMSDSSKTVAVASSDDPAPPDGSSDASDTTTPFTSGGGPTEYLPIPALRILTDNARTVSSGAESAFTAVVYDGKGNRRDDATVTWSFGDGMRRTGASVFHSYYDPGEYLAIVRTTTSDGGKTQAEVVVTVKDARIKIASLSSRGITLANNDSRTLDLSLWRLSMGGRQFKIPEDTHILAGRTVLFPSQVIELPTADSAFLLYPSGEVAAAYPPTPVPQPSPDAASYKKVSEVEPILSARTNAPVHDEAVDAPAVTAEPAAVGAASPPAKAASTRADGLLRSPWTLGLLGVIVVAGGAFILL